MKNSEVVKRQHLGCLFLLRKELEYNKIPVEITVETGENYMGASWENLKIGKRNIVLRNEIVTLYHGSKSGIGGNIAPISRDRCDFGKGFYMGTECS